MREKRGGSRDFFRNVNDRYKPNSVFADILDLFLDRYSDFEMYKYF